MEQFITACPRMYIVQAFMNDSVLSIFQEKASGLAIFGPFLDACFFHSGTSTSSSGAAVFVIARFWSTVMTFLASCNSLHRQASSSHPALSLSWLISEMVLVRSPIADIGKLLKVRKGMCR